MAERITVASIDLDDIPVRDATRRMQGSVGLIDQSLAALGRRMFSLRNAVTALLGGFTLAGVIFKVSQLTTALITGTDTWKAWAGAVEDAVQRLAKGEDSFSRAARHIRDLSSAAGLTPSLLLRERIPELIKLREALAERMISPTGVAASLADLFLGPGHESEERIAIMKSIVQRDLSAISLEFEKLRVELGLTRKEWTLLTGGRAPLPETATSVGTGAPAGGGGPGQSLFSFFGVATPEQIKDVMEKAREAVAVFTRLGSADPLFPLEKALEAIRMKLESIGLSAAQIDSILTFSTAVRGAETLQDKMEQLATTITKASIGFDVITGAASAFAQSIGGMIEDQHFSLKQFLADMLRSVGYNLLAWGALALITTAFTGWPGYGVAGAALAAGTGAIAIASALAPSNKAVSTSGGLAAGGAGGGGSSFTQNITLSIFGNPSDEQVRTITRQVSKALRDGVQGGSLAFA